MVGVLMLALGQGIRVALAALIAKYPQYTTALPHGPVIAIGAERWRGWSAR